MDDLKDDEKLFLVRVGNLVKEFQDETGQILGVFVDFDHAGKPGNVYNFANPGEWVQATYPENPKVETESCPK